MATRETIAAQVTTMHQELRELHGLVRLIADRVGLDAEAPARVVVRDDGAVFLPGTGWTGSDAPKDGPVSEDGLAKVRELRAARRS